MRADCARFLNELRALIGLRRELPPEGAAWVPGGRVSDSASDVIAEGQGGGAQSPPNSRSAQSGQ
jgi:hypothetical protein